MSRDEGPSFNGIGVGLGLRIGIGRHHLKVHFEANVGPTGSAGVPLCPFPTNPSGVVSGRCGRWHPTGLSSSSSSSSSNSFSLLVWLGEPPWQLGPARRSSSPRDDDEDEDDESGSRCWSRAYTRPEAVPCLPRQSGARRAANKPREICGARASPQLRGRGLSDAVVPTDRRIR